MVISYLEPHQEESEKISHNLNLNFIDSIRGNILYSVSIPFSFGPIQLHINENTVLCQYQNTKFKRNEFYIFELFEDSNQTISVTKRGYILPTGVKTISSTQTNKGMTAKMFLCLLISF
jgi:hypothetical protein